MLSIFLRPIPITSRRILVPAATIPSSRIFSRAYSSAGDSQNTEQSAQSTRDREHPGAKPPAEGQSSTSGNEGGKSGGSRARPKIHDAAGKFSGEKADVERHNKEFEQRKGSSS